jgi:DNA-binding transcriptional LysR family regulator
MHNWNWDDLRFVLAVAEHRSLIGASRELGVNHTTVLRRVNSFEDRYGVRLFDRLPTGYVLTEAGEEILNASREIKKIVIGLERKLIGKDLRLEGNIRITTCDTLMNSVVPDVLNKFSGAYPFITLDITTGSFVSSHAQRDSDIAIMTGDKTPDTLCGRRISNINFSIYGTKYLASLVQQEGISVMDRWIMPDVTLGDLEISRWLRKNIPSNFIKLKADSIVALQKAAQAGLGLVILPCYLGDLTTGLVRINHPVIDKLQSGLWVLTHDDLRSTARIDTFMSFITNELRKENPYFSEF